MYLTKLQMLQNKALPIISKTRTGDSISQQYYKFKVLKIENLFTFEIGKIMHQLTLKKTPNNFNTMVHLVLLAKLPTLRFFYPVSKICVVNAH